MQLTFETENASLNINDKMSALDEETVNEKLLQNGDNKDIVEDVNGKLEANGTSDSVNVQNKENILNNSDETESQKEAGDVISPEKSNDERTPLEESKEAGDVLPAKNPIEECPPIEKPGDVIFLEKPMDECTPVEECKEVVDSISAEKPIDECTLPEGIKESGDDIFLEKPMDQFTPVEECKEAEDSISAEKSIDESTLPEGIKESGDDIMFLKKTMDECKSVEECKEAVDSISTEKPIDECTLPEGIKESGDDIILEKPMDQCTPVEEYKEAEDSISAEKPIDECTLPEKNKEAGDDIFVENPMDECSPLQKSIEAGDIMHAEKLIDECTPLEGIKEAGDDIFVESPMDECTQLKKSIEAGDVMFAEKLVDESIQEEKSEETGEVISVENPIHQFSSVEESALPKDELSKPEVEEKELPVLKKSETIELNYQQDLEVDKKEMPPLDENKESEFDEKSELNLIKEINSDLDKPFVSLTEDISFENNSSQRDEPEESQKIAAQNVEDLTDKTNLVNSAEKKIEAMDIDEKDRNSIEKDLEKVETMEIDENGKNAFEKDLENISENDVTQSISDMVENIVQNLNDDSADDLMDNIDVYNNQKVKSTMNAEEKTIKNFGEESTANELMGKTKVENPEKNEKDESELKGTSVTSETFTHIEENENKMEVDQEMIMKVVTKIPAQINEIEANLFVNKSISNQASSVITKDSDAFQKPLESADIISSDSNIIDHSKNSEEPNIKNDLNIPNSAEDRAVESSSDKVAQDDTTVGIDKKINAVETNSEVIELKSGDSSVNNLDDVDSSIAKMEDDIISLISNNIEKTPDTTTKDITTKTPDKLNPDASSTVFETKDDASDVEEVKMIDDTKLISEQKNQNEKTPEKVLVEKNHTPLIKLSNTMDILSDEDEPTSVELKGEPNKVAEPSEKQCINLIDDDDIMLIDEDINKEDKKDNSKAETTIKKGEEPQSKASLVKNAESKTSEIHTETAKDTMTADIEVKAEIPSQLETDKPLTGPEEKQEKPKNLIPADFFKTYRKNLTDMTRDDLEEFCIMKIVESIIDRSNLNDIRSKLKSMAVSIEEYKKKAMMLTKQNRDLQVVLKSVQEEQKKSGSNQAITPLKITRSVGMQVLMTDKNRRRLMVGPGSGANAVNNANQVNNRNIRNPNQSPRNTPQKQVNNQTIPVPRLVPAGMNVPKPTPATQVNNIAKATAVQNGVKNTSPALKPEKRTHSRMQSQSSSVTVDLTDDEPPSKIATKTSPAPPVRLVNTQNLLAPRQQFSQQVNSPRKVYIPISINGPQPQNVRPGQTIMLKTVGQGPRPRGPTTSVVRAPQNVQVRKVVAHTRHPAPLPDAMKQYQPPNWKALPPAPDLKLSKVENGIVISWKIEGYQEDSYEEIASYQLYAYQETSAPASTSLWKKIGDVKALPLPMACTLTQFMAGYKYYFAVRAVDIRSRLGPFSLPGSILLLNKM